MVESFGIEGGAHPISMMKLQEQVSRLRFFKIPALILFHQRGINKRY